MNDDDDEYVFVEIVDPREYILSKITNSKPSFANSKLYRKLYLLQYICANLIKGYQIFQIYQKYKKTKALINLLSIIFLFL